MFDYSMWRSLILVSITHDCFPIILSHLLLDKKNQQSFLSALTWQGVIEEEASEL